MTIGTAQERCLERSGKMKWYKLLGFPITNMCPPQSDAKQSSTECSTATSNGTGVSARKYNSPSSMLAVGF
jgi:hypothetical protein